MPNNITDNRQSPQGLPYITIRIRSAGVGNGLEVRALVDTGCEHSIVHPALCDRLGVAVKPDPSRSVRTVAGELPFGTIWLDLQFANAKDHRTVENQEVAVAAMNTAELILGWDVLRHFTLTFSPSGEFRLAWS